MKKQVLQLVSFLVFTAASNVGHADLAAPASTQFQRGLAMEFSLWHNGGGMRTSSEWSRWFQSQAKQYYRFNSEGSRLVATASGGQITIDVEQNGKIVQTLGRAPGNLNPEHINNAIKRGYMAYVGSPAGQKRIMATQAAQAQVYVPRATMGRGE